MAALAGGGSANDWIRMASRTRPGQVFYYNAKSGKTQWEAPFDEKRNKVPQCCC